MSPEQWQRVNELFYAALERDPDERQAFLIEACADDSEALREVESLLAAHSDADTFTGRPVFQKAVRVIADEDLSAIEGNRIGPYRIIREIGRGGMGAVYLAERDDDEYKKQVAIKLIKRGMDSDAILARFLSERQILARLEHPNIARLLDGGTTADGRPYFVMEYIPGQPIDRYADEHKLSVTQRLGLFLEVASAVQHSHQHLIVHRDIKPSNIIVTADGTPRLLDFGIAKIITPDTGIAETRSARGWMTPEYSSPEQLRGEAITTATDVYSLGVVLYELMTGRPPYRFENRSPAEVVELIESADPKRPSTAAVRVSPATVRDDEPTVVSPDVISELREGSPEKLRRRLSGDLDNIVLMAMHREKELRYRSAAALADDIRRHLEGRPVVARKSTLSYRASKFIRRNKIAVTASVLIALTLIASSIVTFWQARLARRAQAQAERRFNEVRRLARAVVFDYHDRIRDLAGSTEVREKIVSDALAYLNSLAEDARGDRSLQSEIADAYEKIAEIQGGRGVANLGDTQGAIESMRKCLEIRRYLLAATPQDSALRMKTAGAYRRLAGMLNIRGDAEEAAENYRNAVSMAEGLLSIDSTNRDFRYEAASSYGALGDFLIDMGESKSALENERKALDLYKSIPPDDPLIGTVRQSMATAYQFAGTALMEMNDFAGAAEYFAIALDILAQLSREDPTNAALRRKLGLCHYFQGDALEAQERLKESLDSYRQYAVIAEELSSADPQNVSAQLDRAFAQCRIGQILIKTGESLRAIPHLRRSIDINRSVYESDPGNLYKRGVLIESMGFMVKAYAQAGDISAAMEESRKTVEMIAGTDGNREVAVFRGTCALAHKHIAMAFEDASARSSPKQRRRLREEARLQYQLCMDILLDMQSQGILGESRASLIEEAREGIARCASPIR
jgi:non-specific serine/threonine protein kinase/serine/threonine-protein kinase